MRKLFVLSCLVAASLSGMGQSVTVTGPTSSGSTGVSVVNLSPTTIAGLASVTTTTNPILTAGVSVVEVTDAAFYGDVATGGGSIVEYLQCQTVVSGACTSWLVTPTANGTIVKIGSANSSGSSNTLTFSSIPQTYTTLRIMCWLQNLGQNVGIEFNSDTTGADYQWQQWFVVQSGSSGVGHGTGTTHGLYAGLTTDAAASVFEIPGYANGFLKNAVDQSSTSGVWTNYTVNWASAAAITRIDILGFAANGTTPNSFGAGSTCNLYGIQ